MLRPLGLLAPMGTSFGFVRKHAAEVHSSSINSRVHASGSPLSAHRLIIPSIPEPGFGSVTGSAFTGPAMRMLVPAAAMLAVKNGPTNLLMISLNGSDGRHAKNGYVPRGGQESASLAKIVVRVKKAF